MKRIIALSKVFIIIFLRNKGNLFFIFFFNTFMMVIFGLLQGNFYNMEFKIGIYNKDQVISTINKIEKNENYVFFEDVNLLKGAVANGDIFAGIIPSYKKERKNTIIISQSNSDNLHYIEPMLGVFITQLNQEEYDKPQFETETIKGVALNGFNFVFPGLLIFAVMQIGLSGGLTVLNMRHRESLKRLKITPLSKIEFLIGFSISYFILIILQTIINIFVGVLCFGYRFEGHFIYILPILIIAGVTFILLGLVITNFASSMEMGNNLNRFLTFPSAFFCNVFFSASILPYIVQKIAYVHPLTYYVNVFRYVCNTEKIVCSSVFIFELVMVFVILFTCFFMAVRYFKWEEQLA